MKTRRPYLRCCPKLPGHPSQLAPFPALQSLRVRSPWLMLLLHGCILQLQIRQNGRMIQF
ncbi:hypothetical protein PVAP13_1NG122557 [Panicum virgatum]|uniref:Uncharacterized protein n=1 Tax=Panicum virgatum TaxID=38727 RepID=A0A8T0WVE6_PANVG|nr:hypothetical protein PVAP13_1NG122557 [Panicum virgatum]